MKRYTLLLVVLTAAMSCQTQKAQKNECVVGSDLGLYSPAGVYACQNGKWTFDAKATREQAEADEKFWRRREDLYYALRTRVLTPAEEKEAYEMGDSLHEPCDGIGICTYNDDDKVAAARELNDAWYQQRRLQMLAKEGCKGGAQ